MIAKKYIAFDIGKSKILLAILKIRGENFDFLEIEERKNPHSSKKIEKIIFDFCQSARNTYRTKKVAISAAHIVSPERKIVSQGKACYGTDFFDFSFLERAGFSLRIENDGHCFALGEYFFGKGLKSVNILTLAIGTEIGGGMIIDGKIFNGAHNSAMEVSHISSNFSAPWVDFAALTAGKGIENSYRRKSGKKISAENIFLLAESNNTLAKEVVDQAADILGAGIASLINIFDPDLIIFGGSLTKQKKFFNQAIQAAKKNVFNKSANYKFAISSLGNKANLLGAASLFM
jgi:predicted NBD/HSP70 family sugar kinase